MSKVGARTLAIGNRYHGHPTSRARATVYEAASTERLVIRMSCNHHYRTFRQRPRWCVGEFCLPVAIGSAEITRVEHTGSAERNAVVVEHQESTYGRIDEIERNLAFAERLVNRQRSLERLGRRREQGGALVGVLLQQNVRMALVIRQPCADARQHELHNK